ncbi:MAG TPA: TlpA disulfide reductase family protein [Gemmataceae bacterium]|nr:TlpA disulfide reductase family protein [Gemmataceae bacterium]
MSAVKLICPDCQAVLRSTQELPPGKRIKCSACAAVFTVEEGAGAAARAARSAPRAAAAPRASRVSDDLQVVEDDDYDRRPRRGRSRPPVSTKQSNMPLVLGLCAVGAVVFIGVVVTVVAAAMWAFSSKKNEPSDNTNPLYQVRHSSIDDGISIRDQAKAGPKKGDTAPDIEGVDIDGKPLKLSDYRGKVVLLDFWADWCPHCAKMYPHQRDWVQKNANKPFALLGVNTDPSKETLRGLVQRREVTWKNWWDGRGTPITSRWGVDGFPTTFVIDHKGVIRDIIVSARAPGTYERWVERLLAEVGK